MKILFLDCETSANLAHVWGLWNENIPLDRLLEQGQVLCWSAKWLGKKEVFDSSLYYEGEKRMVQGIHDLLAEADAVVTYNGDKFDLPHLNREFVQLGLGPPAPYKKIDLLKTVRQQFRFPSNKLAYVVEALGVGKKADNGGYKTWLGCMEDDPVSWERMLKYNRMDVIILERLYKRILPWIKGHPNLGLYVDNPRKPVCPKCGSTHIHSRGTATTNTGVYQRFHCKSCGDWSRSRYLDEARTGNILVRYQG